jgi:hypothetical protein
MNAPLHLLIGAAAFLCASEFNGLRADEPSPPAGVFPPDRYESLWNKSPFSVATAEAAPDSPDYMLVGIAQIEGISYASLIDRQTQEHFLVSSNKANRGITLSSVTEGKNGADTLAVVVKDGQPLTLKLETVAGNTVQTAASPGAAPAPSFTPPPQQIPMPGANLNLPPSNRPLIRFHRPLIHLPTQPPETPPAPAPAPPPNP